MSRRTERVAEAIREVVSHTILFELSDPRVKGVTVLGAQVTGDLRNAKIFVSIMGDEKERSLSLHGLKSARGFLQRKVAERLDTRFTPVLEIVEDDSVKRSLEISRLLKEVLPPQPSTPVESEGDDSSEDAMDEEVGGVESGAGAEDESARDHQSAGDAGDSR